MSALSIAIPVEAILAHALALSRPLLGLGVLAALMVVFKPLLIGLLRAALLLVKPRKSLEERSAKSMMESVLMLNRMARDLDRTQPGLANELRALASRN